MSQVGPYELLSEIGRSALSVTCRARLARDPADKEGRFVVKLFDVEALALLEGAAAAQTFIERAQLQRRLGQQGAHHWVRVENIGTPEDAWFAAEYYPLTAQKLIERKGPVDVQTLHAVVWSVVRGLTELRETARRAHGNLKPQNILIREDGQSLTPQTSVVLDDPSIEATSARDRSADLMAIGELIHRLVLKRPFREKVNGDDAPPKTLEGSVWPVTHTAIWDRLGPDGERWLDLCNWLLHPNASERPNDLVEVAVALHALTPKPVRRSRKWLVAVAAMVLLAGGAVGFFWKTHSDVRTQLGVVNQQWFGAFERSLDDPARVTRYGRDDTLRTIVQQVQQANQAGVNFDPASTSILSYSGYHKSRSALNVVERIKRDLTPERWSRLKAMSDLRQRYESRGWAQPAVFLADLNRAAIPAPGNNLAAGIDRLLDVAGRITDDAIWLDEQWVRYEADLKVVRESGDPLLDTFARELREAAGATLRLTDAGFDGLDAFRHRMPLASRLAALVKSGFPGAYGRERIAADVDSQFNVSSLTDADIRLWLDAIDPYILVQLDPEAEPLVSLNQSFEKLTSDVKRQTLSAAEQTEYGAARGRLESNLAAFRSARFVKKDVARAQGDISLRAGEIQRELDQLRKQWVRLDDPRQWIAFADQPLASASDALKNRWKGYVDLQRRRLDVLAGNPETFKKAKADAELVRNVLSELDKQFPPVAAGLPETYTDAVWSRRERELAMLSVWAASTETAVPDLEKFALTVDTQGRHYVDWCEKLRSLTKDFPIRKEVLSPADRPDLAWAKSEPEFFRDPIVQGLLEKDLARIKALEAVATMSRSNLLRAAAEAETTEIVLAAWRRLGEPIEGQPAWPDSLVELDAELQIRNRLAPMINGIASEADRKQAADDWRLQGPERWRSYVNSAVLGTGADAASTVDKRIESAQRYRNAMLVTDAEADKLEPAARFNYALFIARISITDATDAVVRTASQQLLRASIDLRDRPSIAELAQSLGRLSEQEPMAGEAALLAATPPQTFSMPVRDRYTLKFVRVEPPRQRPFYLCTTELSLGQYIEIINATGNWTAANTLLGNLSVPGGQAPSPLRGPRAWDRPPANNAAIDRFESWRYDTATATAQQFQFESSLRQTRFNRSALKPEAGDNPKFDHPMQHLSAQAALHAAAVLNCRLPTTREWLTAYEMEVKQAGDVTKIDANLRDATWQRQQQFTTTDVPAQWPGGDLAGVYWPRSLSRPAAAAARSNDDKTLFFRAVAAGGGTFHNLVGNVAEYVCDHDAAWDLLPDRRTVEGVLKFAAQYGDEIQIVGGSAMSSPELALNEPHPVNATSEPYADVGLRLAFTAPARTMAERMKYILDAQTYLAAR